MGLCISLLITSLVVAICTRVGGGNTRTQATIKLLGEGCRVYRLEFGRFPPGDFLFDSRPLHHYLGSPRPLRQVDGAELIRSPIIEFRSDMLLNHPEVFSANNPLPIVDEWNHPIRYANPGHHNKGWVDIWSCGPNEADNADPADPDFSGIINRVRDN